MSSRVIIAGIIFCLTGAALFEMFLKPGDRQTVFVGATLMRPVVEPVTPKPLARTYGEAFVKTTVNLRAGPGRHYRMVEVAEAGDVLFIRGGAMDGWIPVREMATGAPGWVFGGDVDTSARKL